MKALLAKAVAALIVGFARAMTGVRAYWRDPSAIDVAPTLYFANHSSHGDFVLLWATLAPALRQRTRPVAAADYWQGSTLRCFIGQAVFRALLIDRRAGQGAEAVAQMAAALQSGQSLIVFPEGTRNEGEAELLPFKSGLFHLATAQPNARLVPVWIDNLKRVLPKGMWLPVPLACSVHFGAPLVRQADEDKTTFLQRAQDAVLALNPGRVALE